MTDLNIDGLKKLREPFAPNQINRLPKGTKKQNQCPSNEKINCKVCGGWHHPKTIHLDYVGHAALTDRLLDTDPLWYWEPMSLKDGLPAFDPNGGLWIRLTVCGHTRIGYGNAEASDYKEVGSREKEVIGDALRNAAMRFGAALDLWHKGDLHKTEDIKTKPLTKKELTLEQWNTIKSIGAKNKLSEAKVIKLVQFIAIREKISPRSDKIGKLFLPEAMFKKQLEDFLNTLDDDNRATFYHQIGD